VDLDSHFNIIDDPSSGLRFEDGFLVAPHKPGLGTSTPLDD
jgi:L-alanine-DL-glutamate epimerase-like enolase superfamily enzyme